MRWWLRKQWLRLKLYAAENYQNEAESLIIWYAVAFASGAAFYFALPLELSAWVIVGYLEAVLLLLWLTRRRDGQFKLLTYAAVFLLGLSMAKADAMYRARNLEYDLPEISYLRGRVKDMDYNSNNRPRLLLSDVNNFERDLKGDFRISLNFSEPWLKPGVCVELVAKLPQGFTPNPLSNYKFDRANFYKGLSAVGYTVGPVFQVECPAVAANPAADTITRIRTYIKELIDANTPKDAGAIAKALTIGDRSTISEQLNNDYRTSGLAHFLSISGMHMSIIALLVFFLIRATLFPLGEGRYDLRKPAAVVSVFFTFAYFLISGQSVSCIRAFVMTTLVLVAVLFNRRAVSLRLWAFAVLVVVAITPEAVVSPGFLMSFAAVLGLVAFYEKNAARLHRWLDSRSLFGKFVAYMAGLLVSDLVASLMTLPYGVYYFSQISVYTSLGNLLAGPVIGFWVMPALLLFLISLPFGLGAYAVRPFAAGIDVINQITAWVAALPGAKAGEGVGTLPDWGILLLTFGLLWLCIWQAKWRFWGIVGIVAGVVSICFSPRPDFVFDAKGTTYAYRNPAGKLVASRYHKNKFLEKMWTGTKTKGKYAVPAGDPVVCNKQSCIYKGRIEFSLGQVKLDGREIPLRDGGFVNLTTGVCYYRPETGRLWNRTALELGSSEPNNSGTAAD